MMSKRNSTPSAVSTKITYSQKRAGEYSEILVARSRFLEPL